MATQRECHCSLYLSSLVRLANQRSAVTKIPNTYTFRSIPLNRINDVVSLCRPRNKIFFHFYFNPHFNIHVHIICHKSYTGSYKIYYYTHKRTKGSHRTHTHTYARTHARTRARARTRTHTRTHARTHTHTYTHTHAPTHTDTHHTYILIIFSTFQNIEHLVYREYETI